MVLVTLIIDVEYLQKEEVVQRSITLGTLASFECCVCLRFLLIVAAIGHCFRTAVGLFGTLLRSYKYFINKQWICIKHFLLARTVSSVPLFYHSIWEQNYLLTC